jgi:hypothetical protein
MPVFNGERGSADLPGRGSGRRKLLVIGIGAVVFEALTLKLRSGRLAGNVVVRCRKGHLFTTIWIPGASAKSLRLGFWRYQRCPVGHHWSKVTPVREANLSPPELSAAHEHKDIRIP